MNKIIKDYIDNLNYKDIPWHRMFTAFGTAEKGNAFLWFVSLCKQRNCRI